MLTTGSSFVLPPRGFFGVLGMVYAGEEQAIGIISCPLQSASTEAGLQKPNAHSVDGTGCEVSQLFYSNLGSNSNCTFPSSSRAYVIVTHFLDLFLHLVNHERAVDCRLSTVLAKLRVLQSTILDKLARS
jgi:hypothetical protein